MSEKRIMENVVLWFIQACISIVIILLLSSNTLVLSARQLDTHQIVRAKCKRRHSIYEFGVICGENSEKSTCSTLQSDQLLFHVRFFLFIKEYSTIHVNNLVAHTPETNSIENLLKKQQSRKSNWNNCKNISN